MTTFEQEQVVTRLASGGNFTTINPTETDLANPEFRSKIKQLLFRGVVLVEFTKANGETRVMSCTTAEEFGAKHNPIVHLKETNSGLEVTKTKKENTEVCPVWDTKLGAWRSFRWSSVKKIDYCYQN